jgi:hypothetical protein
LALAGVLLLGSIGGCTATLNTAVRGVVHTQRINQSGPLHLDKGKYTVYSTGPRVSIADLRAKNVPTARYQGNATYTANSVRYVAVSTFTAGTSGLYRLTLNKPGPVAIGHGLTTAAKTDFGLSALGAIAGLTLGIVVLVRRRRAARRQSAI